MIGYSADSSRPLLPTCHITTQTHIEVVIDGKGNFRRAQLVDKEPQPLSSLPQKNLLEEQVKSQLATRFLIRFSICRRFC
jgi:hypothetical protein